MNIGRASLWLIRSATTELPIAVTKKMESEEVTVKCALEHPGTREK